MSGKSGDFASLCGEKGVVDKAQVVELLRKAEAGE